MKLFEDGSFFGRNGTLQQMSGVGSMIGQSRSDNAISRIQGLTGLVAEILSMIM